MTRPVLYVDFNEMVDANTVLLCADDFKKDVSGAPVELHEGLLVSIYTDDEDEHGAVDNLIAQGVVVRHSCPDFYPHVKWCCRIDGNGIRHQSDVDKSASR